MLTKQKTVCISVAIILSIIQFFNLHYIIIAKSLQIAMGVVVQVLVWLESLSTSIPSLTEISSAMIFHANFLHTEHFTTLYIFLYFHLQILFHNLATDLQCYPCHFAIFGWSNTILFTSFMKLLCMLQSLQATIAHIF